LGNGDGTFSKSQAFLGAPAASAFAFGDFNRDGNEDIVFAGGMQAHVLFGDGTGKFASSPGFGFFPFPPVGLVAADFNGDGILDLEVSPTYGGFYVLLGNADGTFQPEQNNTSLDYAIFPLAGDFNGDGILDLAVYDEGGQALNILAGNGDGTFQLPVPVPTGIVAAPFYVNDLNADGKLDIVFEPGTADRNIGVLIGNGDGTFQPPQFFATGYVAYPIFAIGDFNSDGLTDLFATKEADGSVASLELGNGDGTFQSASRVHLPGRMVEKTQRIFVGDFNSDGLLDFDLPLLDGSEVFLQQPQ